MQQIVYKISDKKVMNMSIGERITSLRKQQNLSQGKLASILEVSRQAVSKWENDLAAPDTLKLIQLADVLKTDVEYLATGRLSLLEGVRKMSTMAADRLRLPQKGNFLPGSDADVVIFDLNRVTDRATFEDGQIPSEGFDWVLIGGKVALQNDRIINNRLGRSVRR